MTLRKYQIEDVAFLEARQTAGCFNQMRTGKTPTILTVLKNIKTEKNLIVCPASLIFKWKEEYELWTGKPCIVIHGTPKQKSEQILNWTSGLVISYGSLKETKKTSGLINQILKENIDACVIDEAHRIKNPKTATFKAIKKLTKIERRYALTGTPAPGKPEEVWGTLHFLNPKVWSSFWKFAEEYFYVKQVPYGNKHYEIGNFRPGKERELQDYLNLIATNRKRKDIMQWLPEKEKPIRINLEATSKQKKWLNELMEFYETEEIVTKGTLDRLIRYRQICLEPALLDLKGNSPKTEWIIQYLEDYPERPTIIFSKFTSYLWQLNSYLKKYKIVDKIGVIVGSVTPEIRQQYVKWFQEGVFNLLLINIDAGKEGLTLDRAEAAIFTDKYPPVGDIEQAEDRIIATVQDKADIPKTIYELCIKDTYDEQLYDLLEKRKSETDVINDFKKYSKGNE